MLLQPGRSGTAASEVALFLTGRGPRSSTVAGSTPRTPTRHGSISSRELRSCGPGGTLRRPVLAGPPEPSGSRPISPDWLTVVGTGLVDRTLDVDIPVDVVWTGPARWTPVIVSVEAVPRRAPYHSRVAAPPLERGACGQAVAWPSSEVERHPEPHCEDGPGKDHRSEDDHDDLGAPPRCAPVVAPRLRDGEEARLHRGSPMLLMEDESHTSDPDIIARPTITTAFSTDARRPSCSSSTLAPGHRGRLSAHATAPAMGTGPQDPLGNPCGRSRNAAGITVGQVTRPCRSTSAG